MQYMQAIVLYFMYVYRLHTLYVDGSDRFLKDFVY